MSLVISRTTGTAKLQDTTSGPAFSAAHIVSLGCWVKISTSGLQTAFMSLGTTLGVTDGSVYLVSAATTGFNQQVLRDTAGSVQTANTSTTDITDGAWHHVLMVIDGPASDVYTYIDGTLEFTDTTLTVYPANPLTTLRLGNRPDDNSTYWFDGKLAEVFIYQGDVTAITGGLAALQTKQARFVLDDGNLVHCAALYDVYNATDNEDLSFTPTTSGDGAISMDSADHPVTRSTVAWTLACMPDTQNYTQANATRNAMLTTQVDWFVDNRAAEGINFLTHVGDITATNGAAEWAIALPRINDALVAGGLEYNLSTGNHDNDDAGGTSDANRATSDFNDEWGDDMPTAVGMVFMESYTGTVTATGATLTDSGASGWVTDGFISYRLTNVTTGATAKCSDSTTTTAVGALSSGQWTSGVDDYLIEDYSNSYVRKTMPNGVDYLFMCLEWRPRIEAIDWAATVLAAFPNDLVIITTHENLWESESLDANGHATAVRAAPTTSSTAGQDFWDDFTQYASNVVMVLSGHAVFIGGQTDDDEEGTSGGDMNSPSLHEANTKGRVVHDLTFNTQDNDYSSGLGAGGGWFRLYEFNWDGTLTVRTITSEDDTELAEANNAFSFTLDQEDALPVDINSDLEFYAKFDETSGAPVNSGSSSATMAIEGGATTTQNVASLIPGDSVGKAIQFAANGRVNCPVVLDLAIGVDVTLACFVKFTAVGNLAYLTNHEAGVDAWGFLNGGDDMVRFMLGGKVVEVQQATTMLINTTYHVAVTKNSQTAECIFYLDGVPTVGFPSVADTILFRDSRNFGLDHIGGYGALTGDADAIIDDFRVYSRILNQDEITKLKDSPLSNVNLLDPSVLKASLTDDAGNLKPSLTTDYYSSGIPGAARDIKPGLRTGDDLAAGLIDSAGNLKPGMLK